MDFNDSPEEARYRTKVAAWLAAHAPRFEAGPDIKPNSAAWVRLSKAWQKVKAEAGYAGITWPREVGGQGGAMLDGVIFQQEEQRYRVPNVLFQVGMGMCLPTVIAYASSEQTQRFVGPALRGEEVWCQLFSEPAAGSDLAGIRTRAVSDGDEWIINGQKVWNSYAQYSDFAILLTRTDPSVPKHAGLTMFWLDMRTPGVEVRPIRTLAGDEDFNEVFLSDVRIPDAQRLGAVNSGWKVALTTLMHERLAIGKPPEHAGIEQIIALTKSIRTESGGTLLDAADVRDSIARYYVNDAGLDFLRMRAQTALSKGLPPGPEASIGKLVMAKTRQDLSAFALDLLESGAIIEDDDRSILSTLQQTYFWAPGLRIAGGTDEILRNIVAERVLGLPADYRPDKDVPFNQQ